MCWKKNCVSGSEVEQVESLGKSSVEIAAVATNLNFKKNIHSCIKLHEYPASQKTE